MALSMLLSSLALVIHFFFDAIAYEFYLPMVAGLSTSLMRTTRPLIEQAEAALRSNEAAPELLSPITMPANIPVPSWIGASGVTGNTTAVAVKPPRGKPALNPYKLGRRRAENLS